MERPFYVSDGVLNAALVGLTHKRIAPSDLPAAVAPISAALAAKALDPASEAWALISAVFAYESAYIDCPVNSISAADMVAYQQALAQLTKVKDKAEAKAETAGYSAVAPTVADAASTQAQAQLVARFKMHQGPIPVVASPAEPENQRYLSPQLMAALESYSSNAVVWLSLLVRLQGTGIKVPTEQLFSFLCTYCRLKSSLNPLYQTVPLEFLSSHGRYLLSYMSSDLAAANNDYDDHEEDATETFSAAVGSADWFTQVSEQWRHGSAVERKGAVAVLLRNFQLDFLLELLESDFKSLAAAERTNLVALLSAHWLAQLTHGYERAAQGAITTTTNITAATTESAPAPQQRLTAWLMGLVQTDRSKDVKAKATALLRCVPGSPLEEQIVALVRQVYTVKEKNGKRSYSLADVSTAEYVQQMSVLLPEIDSKYLQKDARLAFAELCWYVSPALWFELFKLERSGDEAQDAQLLFTTFKQAFPGMEALKAKSYHYLRDIAVLYFINRIGPELGEVYRAAFYQHCAESLPYEVVIAVIKQASYAERETLPLVLAPQRFPLVFKQQKQPVYELLSFATQLCTEPALCWGPKFSQFYLDLLLQQYDREQWAQMYFYSITVSPNNLETIAWALAPQVRVQAVTRLQALSSKLQADIATREQEAQQLQDAKAREDKAKLQRLARESYVRQNGLEVLELLLAAIAQAERVHQLCAQIQSQSQAQAVPKSPAQPHVQVK